MTDQLDEAQQLLEQGRQKELGTEPVNTFSARNNAASHSVPGHRDINKLAAFFNEGNFTRAETLAREMTVHFPQHGFGWKVLGTLLSQMGRRLDALPALQKAAALSPGDVEAQNNLGITYHALGRLTEAEASCRLALRIQPDYAEAHNILGIILMELGRPAESESSYREALKIKPDFAEAYSNLGNTLHALNRLEEAEASYRQALQFKPNLVAAHSSLGGTVHKSGRYDEACASYRRALQINSGFVEAHSNLGLALFEMGRLDEAEASCRHALKINPGYAGAYNNLGNILKEQGRLGEAEVCYRQALQLQPDYAEAHSNLAFVLLAMGRFSEGWQEHEYRWEGCTPKPPRPATCLPQWTGQDHSAGERLLIFGEQGIGDHLQFSRYLQLAAECFGNGVSIVVGQTLQALFLRSFPGIEVLNAIPADQSHWQWQCPLLSLPLAFDTSPETIPGKIPYLIPDPVKVDIWKAKIAALDLPSLTQKVGIVWKTGKLTKNSHLRSVTLQQLSPLLNKNGCVWFSLQIEHDPDSTPWISAGKLIDWSGKFADFDDTAALMMNLDRVISVDTSVVHLAGALGKPTWLLNRYASEWRWMREREDNPWYPTVRVFTQKKAGDWEAVVESMSAEPWLNT